MTYTRELVNELGGLWQGDLLIARSASEIETLETGQSIDNLDDSGAMHSLLKAVHHQLFAAINMVHADMAAALKPLPKTGNTKAPKEAKDEHDTTHTLNLYGKTVVFTRNVMYDNRRRMQPREVVPKHVVALITRARPASTPPIDVLDGTIRSKFHIVVHTADGIRIEPLPEVHAYCRDAGHDLSDFVELFNGNATLEEFLAALHRKMKATDDVRVRKRLNHMWYNMAKLMRILNHWWPHGASREHVFAMVAARLLYSTDKVTIVFEGGADRGKSTFALCIALIGGTYVVTTSNEAIEGRNTRRRSVAEALMTACGARIIIYDEVDHVDEAYLKRCANGVESQIADVGMQSTVKIAAPAMRILTRNPNAASVLEMRVDTRKKIALVSDDVLKPPPRDDEAKAFHAKLKARTPAVARSLFIYCLYQLRHYKQKFGDKGFADLPLNLRAGPDLLPSASTVPAPLADASSNRMEAIRQHVQDVFYELYDVVPSDSQMPVKDIRETLATDGHLPFVAGLPVEAFLEHFLGVTDSERRVGELRFNPRASVGETKKRTMALNVVRKRAKPTPPEA